MIQHLLRKTGILTVSIAFSILGMQSSSVAQCTNASAYATATAPTSGTTTISTCQYQTEYSTVNSVVAGSTYQSAYSGGGCITVHSGTPGGPVVAWGNSPLTWTAAVNGTHYIHYNTTCACGTASSCLTSTITFISSSAPTCSDGIQNGTETGIDCGGTCPACAPGCSDGIQNGTETGVDCGGTCPPCVSGSHTNTACANVTVNVAVSSSVAFYDDGGIGGNPCLDAAVATGNYCNCNCFTTTTFCAPVGQYLVVNFSEFAMWNTTSGWDWMKIFDNNAASGTVLYDNSSTGPNNPHGDCGIGTPFSRCSSGRCLTFQFWATSVVNRAGWEAIVYSTSTACVIPLPSELISFSAKLVQDKVEILWTTASEVNTAYFVIEKSQNGTDWIEAGEISAAGNSSTQRTYAVTDLQPFDGTSFYRIKTVDMDGAFKYSSVAAVSNQNVSDLDFTAYPNPASDELYIALSDMIANSISFEMYDISGKLIYTKSAQGQSGNYILNGLNDLPSGPVILKVLDENGRMIGRKLINIE
jgi:hypothetical protein